MIAMAFASTDDVAARLGRVLTDNEETIAQWALDTVQVLIAEVLGYDEDWAEALTPVPTTLKAICIEKAVGAVVNPTNVATESETLGAYSVSRTYPRSSDIGIFLSSADRARARRAVLGLGPTSVRTPTALEDFLEDLS